MRIEVTSAETRRPLAAVTEIATPLIGFKAGRHTFTRPAPTIHAPSAEPVGCQAHRSETITS